MRFYDCKTAPSPRRVRIFIAEKNIDIPVIQVDLKSGEHLSEQFQSINPSCTVPVLELDDGTHLTTTAGIWRYLETIHPEPSLMGQTARQQGLIMDLQWRIEVEGFMAMAECLRNSSPRMINRALTGPHNYEQIPELANRGKLRVERFFENIDAVIGNNSYVIDNQLSVADIDLLVLIDFAAWKNITLPDSATNARRWHQEMATRNSAQL